MLALLTAFTGPAGQREEADRNNLDTVSPLLPWNFLLKEHHRLSAMFLMLQDLSCIFKQT